MFFSAPLKKRVLLAVCMAMALPCALFAAPQYAVLDSLAGKAEAQRAGQDQWILVKPGHKLFNNDLIRVLDKSTARLKFQNGSLIYIRQNSQILVSLFSNSETSLISRHVTVFFGAAYFVIKKTLPGVQDAPDDVKIYTPTTVVSLRGTSFVVEVDEKTGATSVQVVNGTVLVRNILKNASLFVGAGYKTTILMNTDPLLPVALLQTDIDALKTWVPVFTLDAEMQEQIARARRDHLIITGKFDDKLVVQPFANTSRYKGPWNISSVLARALADRLLESNSSLAVGATDSLAADPIQQGHTLKARYIVTGTIQEFDIQQRAQISVRADEYKEFNTARVVVAMQLIDIAAKKLIYENTFTGELSLKNSENTGWQYLRKLEFNLNDSTFSSTILGRAALSMLEQSAEKLTACLRH